MCGDEGEATVCSATPSGPMSENCNGVDDNCDGQTDEGFPDTDSDGEPDCTDEDDDGDGTRVCAHGGRVDELCSGRTHSNDNEGQRHR